MYNGLKKIYVYIFLIGRGCSTDLIRRKTDLYNFLNNLLLFFHTINIRFVEN